METTEQKTIYVHECTFCTMDDDGDNLVIYEAPKLDWSHISEYVDMDDLVELKSPDLLVNPELKQGLLLANKLLDAISNNGEELTQGYKDDNSLLPFNDAVEIQCINEEITALEKWVKENE